MLGFLLVVAAMLLMLVFRLEMVCRLQTAGGSRELVGTGQLFSLLFFMGMSLGRGCELVARGGERSFLVLLSWICLQEVQMSF